MKNINKLKEEVYKIKTLEEYEEKMPILVSKGLKFDKKVAKYFDDLFQDSTDIKFDLENPEEVYKYGKFLGK